MLSPWHLLEKMWTRRVFLNSYCWQYRILNTAALSSSLCFMPTVWLCSAVSVLRPELKLIAPARGYEVPAAILGAAGRKCLAISAFIFGPSSWMPGERIWKGDGVKSGEDLVVVGGLAWIQGILGLRGLKRTVVPQLIKDLSLITKTYLQNTVHGDVCRRAKIRGSLGLADEPV